MTVPLIKPRDAVAAIARKTFGSAGERELWEAASILLMALRSGELTATVLRDGQPKGLPASLLPHARVSHVGAGSDIAGGIISGFYYWLQPAEFSEWLAGGKRTRKAETDAVKAVAEMLRENPDLKRADAVAYCKANRVSERAALYKVWPDAREAAGLPRAARAGPKPKSAR